MPDNPEPRGVRRPDPPPPPPLPTMFQQASSGELLLVLKGIAKTLEENQAILKEIENNTCELAWNK